MSIKKIILFVILILTAYAGGYTAIYGFINYQLYSATERSFDNKTETELLPHMNIKGSIDAVTYKLGSEAMTRDILGFKINTDDERHYYALPVGYSENPAKQQYCVIAVYRPEDVEAVESLMRKDPLPPDPDAPRFEFRGIVMNMTTDMLFSLRGYINGYFVHTLGIYGGTLYNANILPYTIFVKGDDSDLLQPVIVGGAAFLISVSLFILLAVRTYKKKHMYD